MRVRETTSERPSWLQIGNCFGTKYIQFAKFISNEWLKKAVASSSSFQLPERVLSTKTKLNEYGTFKTSDIMAGNNVTRNDKG